MSNTQQPAACAACGKAATVGLRGILLCRRCAADFAAEAEAQRREGKQVSISGLARVRYKDLFEAHDYTLRAFPRELMARVKFLAIEEGVPARELILRGVEEYVGREEGKAA